MRQPFHLMAKSTSYQYIPIIEQQEVDVKNPELIFPAAHSENKLKPFAVQNGDDYGRFMITIFDEWVKKDVGRIYPEYRLGNLLDEKITKLATSKQQQKFGLDKATVGATCEACEYLFACNGGCPKHRIQLNEDGSRQNHLYSGYKMLLKYIDPYMKYMVNELRHHRSPMNVMRFPEAVNQFR